MGYEIQYKVRCQGMQNEVESMHYSAAEVKSCLSFHMTPQEYKSFLEGHVTRFKKPMNRLSSRFSLKNLHLTH